MAYFSFKEGRPIAKISGGKDDDRIIYIGLDDETKDKSKCCDNCTVGCGLTGRKCCKNCTGKCDHEPDIEGGSEYDKIFNNEFKRIRAGQFPYINLPNNERESVMVPIPLLKKEDELKRENILISGPEGAGKSYWASKYIEQYRQIYPESKFIIFSGIDEDKPLDKLKPLRVKLNEKIYENPIKIDEFPNNSIVLFDDVDTLEDKKVQKALLQLRDRLLEKGRHRGIFVISITHNPNMGKDTKASLLESSSIVLFPRGGDTYHMKRTLKEYCGYDPKSIDGILKLKSRWIQCHKRYPKFILHEKGAFFP